MDERSLQRYVRGLKRAHVVIDRGLDAAEVRAIESEYGFQFPPDLKEFLMYALPISDHFIDWRRTPRSRVLNQLEWPLEGIRFDIAMNTFWMREWGPRPADIETAYEIARQAVAAAPVLIPILGHRYIPSRPHERDNPVFSVYQTDIIYYGRTLFDYFENEFYQSFGRPNHQYNEPFKPIEFWSRLVALNDGLDPDPV